MPIRYRPMQHSDVRACADIVASVPAARRIYGEAIADLYPAWMRLLGCEAKTAVVFEEMSGSHATICAVGVSVFVQEGFVRELKARPFWFAPELARRLGRGYGPLLSVQQLREGNSRGDLTALVWEGRVAPGFEENAEVYRKLANGFIETHRGFYLKEAICHQIETVGRLNWSIQTGGLPWDAAAGGYTDRLENPEEFLRNPHVFGVTRETEDCRRGPGSWIGGLFEYQPPRFGFSRSQQRLLLAALNGPTDQELSRELGLSLFTIKKTWRSVYERVARSSPELVPNAAAQDGTSERGREKRKHLLGYLRSHLEELRPVSQKLLQQNAAMDRRDSVSGHPA